MTRFKLQLVKDRAAERPEGYFEDVVGAGRIVGDEIEFDDDVYRALVAKYGSPVRRLTLAEKVRDFARLSVDWAKAGFPLVAKAELEARGRACEGCPHWRAEAMCELCGCTELKHEIATSKCPIGKWPERALQQGGKIAES